MIDIGIDCMLDWIVDVNKCIIMVRWSKNRSEWNAGSCVSRGRGFLII